MILSVIEIFLLCLAIKKYTNGKYVFPMVYYAFLATNGFILNLGMPIIKPTDLGLLFLAVCCIIGYANDRNFFSTKGIETKLVKCFLLFWCLSFIYTYCTGADYLSGIITELRSKFAFVAYFVFRKASTIELKKGLEAIIKLLIFTSVLFVIQYFTHYQLVNTFITGDSYRMQITPPFTMIVLLFLFLYGKGIKFRWFFVVLLFSVMIISQNRTPLYSFILQIGVFVILSKNFKKKILIVLLMTICISLINTVSEKRAYAGNENTNVNVDILSYIETEDYVGLAAQSSFMWRIAHIAERTQYLFEHPNKLLLGVGAIDENSPKNRFNFKIGTNVRNENGQIQKYQLRSGDVFWSPIIIKYGLLGLMLHISLMTICLVLFYKDRNIPYMMIGFLYMVGAFSSSFSSAGIFDFEGMFIINILLIISERVRKENVLKIA